MPKYVVFKKSRARSGQINREAYLYGNAKTVRELVKAYSGAGVFTSGDYVAFRVLKSGKISKAGKPFTI